MSRTTYISDFAQDDDGATLLEFAVVLGVFLFMVFGIIDYARLGFAHVMAEKVTETAVRMAVVSPAICEDVPAVNTRGLAGTLAIDVPNGTPCTAQSGLCAPAQTVTCAGSTDNATVAAIWGHVQPLLPNTALPEHLEFTYHYDANLNRVGAPYAPVVTVALADMPFDFISPLGALANFAGAEDSGDLGGSYAFPSMSASLPSEDLK